MSDADLLERAQAAGLAVDWIDFDGVARRVGPDTLRAVLSALGQDLTRPGQDLPSPSTKDFLILDAGAPRELPTPVRSAQLILEDGSRRDLTGDGRGLTLVIDTPGYHSLELEDRRLTLAVCPPRCRTPRDLLGRKAWGLTAQIYALRDHGAFGDFTDLAALARAAGAAGADALAISPTNALFPSAPKRCSPYSPSSRDHLNILFADPAALGVTPAAVHGEALIDWPDAAAAKMALLNGAYHAFSGDPRLDAFITAGGQDLRRHAIFEALEERLAPTFGAGAWRRWPAEHRNIANAEASVLALGLGDRVGFFLFAHWLADLGLAQAQATAKAAGMGLGLIADLAVGLDPGGAHAWSRPQELMLGLSLGAPPDAFQAAGQGWGLTSFSPSALAAAGYQPFLKTLRAALRHAGGARIDHALGLGRLWLIPEGAEANQGVYLRYPLDDLLALIALESHRAGAVIIGEDLGVVPEGLRQALTNRGLLGMRVLPFERDATGGFTPPGAWDDLAAAMTSTHDLPPTAGWWRGRDIDWRARLGAPGDRAAERATRQADRTALWTSVEAAGVATGPEPSADTPKVAVDAALDLIASTPCQLALIPIEDLLGLDEQPNLPGVVDTHPNWRRRLPAASADLLTQPLARERLARLNAQRPR